MQTANELLDSPCQELTSSDELRGAIEELAQRLTYFEERRSTSRYPFNVPLSLFRKTDEGLMEIMGRAWGLNISPIGLGLLSRKNFERNAEIYVDLKPLTGETRYVKLRIVHCSDSVDEMHRIGGYFAF